MRLGDSFSDAAVRPLVSVVVPVLDDSAAAARVLADLPPEARQELVLVDGGNDAALDRLLAARPDVRLIRTRQGRGHQMNTGADAASGEWLLFLHADSRLPDGWLDLIAAVPVQVTGGWFRFALDHPAWQARFIERVVAWRVRILHLPYGDQGLFARRSCFAALGGYRDMPLMEDVEFIRRLRQSGPTVEIPAPLVTSARRWTRDGWWRRSVRNILLMALYFAGVPPGRLARWYHTGGAGGATARAAGP